MCQHQPPCPPANATDRQAAQVVASHPEQGWSLLCNGIVLFEDTGMLLPGGQAIPPHQPAVTITEDHLSLLRSALPGRTFWPQPDIALSGNRLANKPRWPPGRTRPPVTALDRSRRRSRTESRKTMDHPQRLNRSGTTSPAGPTSQQGWETVPTPGRLMSRRALLQGSAAAVMLYSAGVPLRFRGLASAAPPAVAGPKNVRVSRDGFTMHAEPYLAANPRDPRNLLGACMVWQAGKRGLASYASFDGGRTWRSNGLLPGVVPDYDGDVTVAFTGQGTGFICGWVGNRSAKQQGRVHVWRTEDGGRRFLPPVTAATGLVDHPWLAADKWACSAPGTLYLAGDYFGRGGLVFTRSTDGGRTFGALRFLDPRSGSSGGRAAMIATCPGGVAAIAYFVELPDASQLIKVVSSADYGRTFTPPVLVTRVMPPPIISKVNTTTGGPAIAAHPDGSGLWVAVATVDAAAQVSELQVFCSQDQGRSWSPPITVARSGQVVYFQPQLAADDAGRMALSAFALPVATGRVEVLMFVSEPGGSRFGQPTRVTAQAFDPHAGTQQGWIGDYQGLTATPGAFHPFWNDTRTGRMQIYTATVRPG